MFYVETAGSGRAVIEGEAAAHLRKVLRAERGQLYEVSDNESLFLAEITGFSKDRVELAIREELPKHAAAVRLHLLAALIKFDHFEWILEKATELGAARITPVAAARTGHGLEEAARKRSERWRKILFESGQQARRVTRPELAATVDFAAALQTPALVHLRLEEGPGALPILRALPSTRTSADTVCLLVGPEGGWEDRERALAGQAGWTPVSLGSGILRAETAAIAALAVLSAAWQQCSTGEPV